MKAAAIALALLAAVPAQAEPAPRPSATSTRVGPARERKTGPRAQTAISHTNVPASPAKATAPSVRTHAPSDASSAPTSRMICTPSTARSARPGWQTSKAAAAWASARARSSARGSKREAAKVLVPPSTGRTVLGHTLTGRVSAPSRVSANGAWSETGSLGIWRRR